MSHAPVEVVKNINSVTGNHLILDHKKT